MDETTIETGDFINALASRLGQLEKENIALTLLVRKQESIISNLNSALMSVANMAKDEPSVPVVL